jgi:hypothetical protein
VTQTPRNALMFAGLLSLIAGLITWAPPRSNAGDIAASTSQIAPATNAETSAVSSGAAPVNDVKYGDLTNETYSATGPLTVALVSPPDGAAVATIATKIVAETVKDAGVELRVNGEIVSRKKLGARIVDDATGMTRFEYYGIVLAPGPNRVELTPLGAEDARGATIATTLYGPGAPASLAVHVDGELRADGRTPATLHVAALDRWGHPAVAGSRVTISASRGDVRIAPLATLAEIAGPKAADPRPTSSPSVGSPLGTKLQTIAVVLRDGGTADAQIVPGLTAGDVDLAVDAADASTRTTLTVRPNLRAPLVSGLVTVGTGAVPGDVDGDENVDNGGSRRSRVAVFGTGAVSKTTEATFAYETANRLAPSSSVGGFVQDPDERPYRTYGDSSTRRIDALSDTRLYARLENGRDALTYGRFDARVGDTDAVGQFSRLANGVHAELGLDRRGDVRASAFEAKNAVAYAKQTFDPSGLATLGQLLHPQVVVGSETVTLVAFDRRTGAIVSQTQLQRDVDYVLDYASGALRFVTIPLPFDAAFNPQSVVVRYEYLGTRVAAQTAGAQLEVRLGRSHATALDVGYVNDVSGGGNYALFEQTLHGTTHGGSWTISHASAAGVVTASDPAAPNVGGGAIHAAYSLQSGRVQVRAGYDDTGAGFSNPFGGLTTSGLRDARVSLRESTTSGDVGLSYDAQATRGNGTAAQSSLELSAHRKLGKLTLGSALAARNASNAGIPAVASASQSATQLTVDADYSISKSLGLNASRIENIAGSSTSQPAQSLLGITWNATKSARAYLRTLWSAAAQVPFANTAIPYALGTAPGRQTTFGIERTVGSNTSVASEYTMSRIGAANQVFSSVGVHEKLKVANHLSGDAFVQTGNTVASSTTGTLGAPSGGDASGFAVYGINAAYDGAGFRGTASLQTRTGVFGGTSLTLGAAGRVAGDLSLLANLAGSRQGTFVSEDARLGLAWRPSRNDRGAGLLEIDRLAGSASAGNGDGSGSVVSYEQVYRPTGRLELDGRLAYKIDGSGDYAAHTGLLGLRVDQRVGSRLDLGIETRRLTVADVNGATRTSLATEVGYRLGSSLRLAGGYGFSASADPMLSARPTRRGFYATFTSVVDRIFGWGR